MPFILKKELFIDLNTTKENKIEKISASKDEIKEEVKDKNTQLSLISPSPKIEELKLVSSYPFYEGQKLADNDSSENENETEEELKKIEELKQVSMDEFDKADDEKQEELKVEAKIIQIDEKKEEKSQKVEEVKKIEKRLSK